MAKQSAEIFEDGDFCLTHAERAMVDAVTANFSKVIVVMNACRQREIRVGEPEAKRIVDLLVRAGNRLKITVSYIDILCVDKAFADGREPEGYTVMEGQRYGVL